MIFEIYAVNAHTDQPAVIVAAAYKTYVDTIKPDGEKVPFDEYIYDAGINNGNIWITPYYADYTFCYNPDLHGYTDSLILSSYHVVDTNNSMRQCFYNTDSLLQYFTESKKLSTLFVPGPQFMIRDVKYLVSEDQLLVLTQNIDSDAGNICKINASTGEVLNQSGLSDLQSEAQIKLSPDETLIALLAAEGQISKFRASDLS
jgi:hypothetical protein